MTAEYLQNKIKLIFARSCAKSSKETTSSILAIEDDAEIVRATESHGAAFIALSRHFICETSLKQTFLGLHVPVEWYSQS